MIIQEIMSPDPYSAAVTASVGHVLQILAQADVRHVPIVNENTLVGIVSDRDIRAVIPDGLERLERSEQSRRILAQPISEVMSSDVVFVNPEDDVSEAIDLMIEHRIGAVPVVEPGGLKLIGIVSYVDVLRAARESM